MQLFMSKVQPYIQMRKQIYGKTLMLNILWGMITDKCLKGFVCGYGWNGGEDGEGKWS